MLRSHYQIIYGNSTTQQRSDRWETLGKCQLKEKYKLNTKHSSSLTLPGNAAGDSGPVRDGVMLAGEPTGDGEGPRVPGRWGGVCGEKGDWAGLLCSP